MSHDLANSYTALLRTLDSESTLPATLACLSQQTVPPRALVVVDSGSRDATLASLPPEARVLRYRGDSYNYSAAINQGLGLVESPFVLLISSHTTLHDPTALSYALSILQNDAIGAAYFTQDVGPLQHSLIGRETFDGFNGLWNTCSLIRTHLALRRPFREEVFAAEDQEWAKWLIEERGGLVARISGAGMSNDANVHAARNKWRKRRNEYMAIAWFVRPSLRSPRNIAALAYQSVSPFQRRSLDERLHLAGLSARMLKMRWVPPVPPHRYY